MPGEAQYDVFLSYAREDEERAKTLQLGLQRLARPWWRTRALHVFRDRTSLPGGNPTWPSLQEQLERSRWFVLVASPNAARSQWVAREVAWWRRHHTVELSTSKIIIVRAAGELAWAGRDVDWSVTTCLPRQAMRRAFREPQTWVDLPEDASPDQLRAALRTRPGAEQLRECLVRVAARVRGIPPDEMDRAHVRRRRWTAVTAALVSVLLLVLLGGLVVADRRAQDGEDTNIASGLVARAASRVEDSPRLALQLGIAADRIHPDEHTAAGLVDTLTRTRYGGQVPGEAGVFDPRGSVIATTTDDHVTLWDVGTGRAVGAGSSAAVGGATVLAWSPDGRVLATAFADGSVSLDDVSDPSRPVPRGRTTPVREPLSRPVSLAFVAGGDGLLVGTDSTAPVLWDIRDRDRPGSPRALAGATDVAALAISADGRRAAVASESQVGVWDLADPARPPTTIPVSSDQVFGLAFSTTGLLAVVGAEGRLDVLRPDGTLLDPVDPVDAGGLALTSAAFSPDGRFLVTGGVDDATRLWSVGPTTLSASGPPMRGRVEAVRSVSFSPAGSTVASSGDEGTTVVWRTADPALPTSALSPRVADGVSSVAAGPTGTGIAVVDAENRGLLVGSPGAVSPLVGADDVTALAYVPTGHGIVGIVAGGPVVWDDPAAPPIPLDGGPTDVALSAISVSADGALAAAVDEHEDVTLFDLRSHRAVGPGIVGRTTSAVAFAGQGRTLALGSSTGPVELYDVTDPSAPVPLGPSFADPGEYRDVVGSMTFAPDGSLLAIVHDNGRATLWSITDPATPREVGPALTETSTVAFSRDGRLLLSIGLDGRFTVRDLAEPARPELLGRPLDVGADPFAGFPVPLADGHTVIAGSSGGQLLVVDLAPLLALRDSARERACALVHTGLDERTWQENIPELPYNDSCS